MKIYVKYAGDVTGWRRNQLDLELMLHESHTLARGNALLRQVKNLQELSAIIEANKAIYVLREPMELHGGQAEYSSVEFNIDFIINSSKILFVEPVDETVLEDSGFRYR